MAWYVSSETGGFFQTSFTLMIRSRLQQFGKVFLAELVAAQRIVTNIIVLEAAQLHPADFSGNRLRQFTHEFNSPDTLERRKPRQQMLEDRSRDIARALRARHQQDIGLGDCEPDWKGDGDH